MVNPLFGTVDRAVLGSSISLSLPEGHAAPEVGKHVAGAKGEDGNPPVALVKGHIGNSQVDHGRD